MIRRALDAHGLHRHEHEESGRPGGGAAVFLRHHPGPVEPHPLERASKATEIGKPAVDLSAVAFVLGAEALVEVGFLGRHDGR
jgi:hypothetical protein